VSYAQYAHPHRDVDIIPALGIPGTLASPASRTAQNTFGFTLSDNIGKVSFAAVQASPAFAIAFPDFLEPGGEMVGETCGNGWDASCGRYGGHDMWCLRGFFSSTN